MMITKEIFQVGGEKYTSSMDAAVYLIHFDGQAALVDAGTGRFHEKLLENILKTGVDPADIEYLFLTHCHFDHTGGAKALREVTGCRTVAHELESVFLEGGDNVVTAADWYGASLEPFPVDIKLNQSEEAISLGNRTFLAIHTPGHSPGSVVYLTESEGWRVLFAQDVHGPLHSSLLSNKEDYLYSLRLLLSLEADILCEGHYGVYEGRENVADFIKQFLV
jgi:glyoxylase-like metal-dependent hydrolase (beta-lactamase superfamily II)